MCCCSTSTDRRTDCDFFFFGLECATILNELQSFCLTLWSYIYIYNRTEAWCDNSYCLSRQFSCFLFHSTTEALAICVIVATTFAVITYSLPMSYILFRFTLCPRQYMFFSSIFHFHLTSVLCNVSCCCWWFELMAVSTFNIFELFLLLLKACNKKKKSQRSIHKSECSAQL